MFAALRTAKPRLVHALARSDSKLVVLWALAAVFVAILFGRYAYEASREIDGVRYFYLYDDHMISMRYARNLAEGHGLVWNPGERVEGYTNFGWTLVMALVHLLGASDAKASLYVEIIAYALTVGMLWLLVDLLRWFRVKSLWVVAATLATCACCTDIMHWAAVGFSTPLITFLHVFVISRLLKHRRLDWLTLAALSYLPLVRADSAPLWGADALLALWLVPDRRRTVLWLGASLIPLVAQFGFRLAYYGEWFPNTYYLKVTGRGDRIRLGVKYLDEFVRRYLFLIVMSVAASIGLLLKRPRTDARALGAVVLLSLVPVAAYVTIIGGDNFRPYRHFGPVLPLMILLAALGSEQARRMGPYWGRGVWLGLMMLAVVPLREPWDNIVLVSSRNNPKSLIAALLIKKNAAPDASIAIIPAGIVPYFSRLRALDILGKNDKHIARLPQKKGASIGHGKLDPAYTLGQKPDYVLAHHPLKWVKDASKTAAKSSKKEMNRNFWLTFFSSEPFQENYLKHNVSNKFLNRQLALFVHKRSPEKAHRKKWKGVRVQR